jgi:MEMO1 family protein
MRRPAVAGVFYAGAARELEEQIEWCYKHELGPGALPRVNTNGPGEIVAVVVPHAGYYYSGPVAAHAYKALAEDGVFDTAVIIGPNHTGQGYPVSLWAGAAWNTPLGTVEIDGELARSLVGEVIRADEAAHIHEHSIEVQLPWLQHLYRDVRIVPIAMMAQDIGTARAVGEALSRIVGNIRIIASSDFSHYEPHRVAIEKDSSVVAAIVALDEEELYRRCEDLRCTMCGYGPVAATIVAAKARQARRASLLRYATSGDTGGDLAAVVGYGSIAIRR